MNIYLFIYLYALIIYFNSLIKIINAIIKNIIAEEYDWIIREEEKKNAALIMKIF